MSRKAAHLGFLERIIAALHATESDSPNPDSY